MNNTHMQQRTHTEVVYTTHTKDIITMHHNAQQHCAALSHGSALAVLNAC